MNGGVFCSVKVMCVIPLLCVMTLLYRNNLKFEIQMVRKNHASSFGQLSFVVFQIIKCLVNYVRGMLLSGLLL